MFFDEALHIVNMIRNALLTEEATSIGCDKHIVFDTNATEVAIFINLIEIEELCIRAILTPIIDEGGYEVNTRLISYNVAWFQTTSET